MARGRRRKAPPPKRVWLPLALAVPVPPTEERVLAIRAEAEKQGWNPDEAEDLIRRPREMWVNDRYVVVVRRREDDSVYELSVRRQDRKPDIPWRHLQRIKNQLAGDEVEGIELFPAESRLVDTANQRWVWCLAPGERVPFGFTDGRHVSGPEEAAPHGAHQAALEA